jgi:hypothetical protein
MDVTPTVPADDWQPASPVEQRLLDALRGNDFGTYVAMVAEARLVVPVAAEPGTDRPRPLPVAFDDGTTAVVAFTSAEGLCRVMTPEAAGGYQQVSLTELAEHWPDPAWLLVLNPGLPISAHIPGDRLAGVLASVFEPVNETERAMLAARRAGDGEELMLTVLGAELHVPIRPDGGPSRDITDPRFPWLVERYGADEVYLPVFTSPERLRGRLGDVDFVVLDVPPLLRAWPDDRWVLAVNPCTPVAATLTGEMVRAVARTFSDVVADPLEHLDPGGDWWTAGAATAGDIVLQVALPHQSVGNYLNGMYDRVAGRVHLLPPQGRWVTPASLYLRVGLLRPGGPFSTADRAVHVVRWRPPADRAEEWLADPNPRTGSAVLPDGSALYRISADGSEDLRASFDGIRRCWVSVEG